MYIPYQEYDYVGTVNTNQLKMHPASAVITNPCTEININAVATTYIGTDFIELAGKRFDTRQLAYLLVKLLEEHPECQI